MQGLLNDLRISAPARLQLSFHAWLNTRAVDDANPLQAIPGLRIADSSLRHYTGQCALTVSPAARRALASLTDLARAAASSGLTFARSNREFLMLHMPTNARWT